MVPILQERNDKMSQALIRYEMQLGVSIFNTVVVACSKEEAIEIYLKMLVDEDAIIVTEEDPKND